MSTSMHPRVAAAPPRHALPDVGEAVPPISWPTVGIFSAALALFAGASAAMVAGVLPWAITIALNAVAIFVMFTVVLNGNVEMDHNFALGQEILDTGYVHTCPSHPTTPSVTIDYDA
jgi:hypothetical protein